MVGRDAGRCTTHCRVFARTRSPNGPLAPVGRPRQRDRVGVVQATGSSSRPPLIVLGLFIGSAKFDPFQASQLASKQGVDHINGFEVFLPERGRLVAEEKRLALASALSYEPVHTSATIKTGVIQIKFGLQFRTVGTNNVGGGEWSARSRTRPPS